MFTQVIAYQNNDGSTAIIEPAENCGLTLEQIALKDVPKGKPYVYLNRNEIPQEIIFFDAFEVDVSNPNGHGADWGMGSDYTVMGWNYDGSPITMLEQK